MSTSLRPHGLYSLWNSPGQNTGVGSLFHLQGIVPIQVSNPGLLHCRQILYQMSHKGSPYISHQFSHIVVLITLLGEGSGTPLQYSCLENPINGGAWWSAVHARCWTRLSDFTFTFHFHALEKEMATHSSVLAWRIPEMGEPGGLPSMGSHRVRHD